MFISPYFFGTSVMSYVAVNLNLPIKILCPSGSSCSLLGLGDMALPGLLIVWARQQDRRSSSVPIKQIFNKKQSSGTFDRTVNPFRPAIGTFHPLNPPSGTFNDEHPIIEKIEGIPAPEMNLKENSHSDSSPIPTPTHCEKSYFLIAIFSYAIALLLCLTALLVFQTGQPALLYISPCLMGGIVWRACSLGELKSVWMGIKEKRKEETGRDERLEGERDEFYRDNMMMEEEKEKGNRV